MSQTPAMGGPKIYRGFTRAELDREYSPSSMVQSIEPFLMRYARDSAAARRAHDPSRWATHAWGQGREQTLDLFLPARTPAPLFVFIHGGYWQALSKDDSSFPASAITAAGFGYAAINYTLAPDADMDVIVEEIRRALVWLWEHRAALGIDGKGIVLSGHSAGAHLAAMMLATDWTARGIAPGFIKRAILIGGVYDLEPIRLSYVNDPLRLDEAAARRNSPIFLQQSVTCPVIICWAENETGEFKRQSREFATVWGAMSGPVTFFEQPGVNHFDCLFEWRDPASRLYHETMLALEAKTISA